MARVDSKNQVSNWLFNVYYQLWSGISYLFSPKQTKIIESQIATHTEKVCPSRQEQVNILSISSRLFNDLT